MDNIYNSVNKTQMVYTKYIKPLWYWIKNESHSMKDEAEKRNYINSKLYALNDFIAQDETKPLFHIDPSWKIKRIIVTDEDGKPLYKIFNSANKPLLLKLEISNAKDEVKTD